MGAIENIGADWLTESIGDLTECIQTLTPSEYTEKTRYLPKSVTRYAGYLRFAVNPYMREIVDCADVDSPIREISLQKGVQITYSTALESIIMYYADFIGTVPIMYVTAEKDLATARIENNFIPMFQQSGLNDIFRSADETSTQKTGKTKDHLQFAKGGYLVPFGANNANKMRSFSICVLAKDEVDAWPLVVGKDGDPDALTDARTDGYTEVSKIFRGSTPLIKGQSVIHKNFLRGDQRHYYVACRGCGHMQHLRWSHTDKGTGVVSGFVWDYTPEGTLDKDSVRYLCISCQHPHYDHDKEWMYNPDNGAEWRPHAVPVDPHIRSYKLPALYSPVGMRPWWKNVAQWLECYDVKDNRVIDIPKYQVFYNNVLAEPFEVRGTKIGFTQVSAHRRAVYRFGEIPNKYAVKFSGSPVLFLTCQVDVHKSNLAVTVMGWTTHLRGYVVRYERWYDEDCTELTSPVWGQLRELIEETEFVADDGAKYKLARTAIDAGFANDTVVTFCSDYGYGVNAILGRDRPGKNQTIKEFAPFTTQAGGEGYKIVVDHYKDRLAPVLRREWGEEMGEQPHYHVNVPIDTTDKQLKELTVETKRQKIDEKGWVSHYWHRPGNAANEFWDLLIYGHGLVEIFAWDICINHFELEKFSWPEFWEFAQNPEYDALFGRV